MNRYHKAMDGVVAPDGAWVTFREVSIEVALLRPYLHHKPTCAADSFDTGLCDCGLRDALARLQEGSQ